MNSRKLPTANQAAYATLEQMLCAPQAALVAFREAIAKGTGGQLASAIKKLRKQGIDPDAVVIRCSSSKEAFWYQPAALVLAAARPNAATLLRTMIDNGLHITEHRCGPVRAGQFRTLAHAFVQGWSAARPAPVPKPGPDDLDIFSALDDDNAHRLDSRAILNLLATQQLDWTLPDSNGQTILHQAMQECETKDLRTVCLLAVDKGVDPGRLDHRSKSAIELCRSRLASASPESERESLSFLLAELSQVSMGGNTPASGNRAPGTLPRI